MSSLPLSLPPQRSASAPHLVLLHGLASTPQEFGLLTFLLRRAGVALHTPVIEGYTHQTLGREARWQDWLEQSTHAVTSIASQYGPVVVGGLCTGAILALGVATRQPSVAGLALLSPLFTYDGWGLPWWYRLRRVAYGLGIEGLFYMHERAPFGLKNPRLRAWVRQQMQGGSASIAGPSRVALRIVRESERLSAQSAQWLADLQKPTLVLHAREDEVCRLSSVQAMLTGAPASLLRTVVLEDSYHMITADNDRQQVAQELAGHAWACQGPQPGISKAAA